MAKYHDLYLKTDLILPADVFKKFRKMCSEVYELDPVKFISALGLAWQTALKNRCWIRLMKRCWYAVNDRKMY